jgi:hypothetical protein
VTQLREWFPPVRTTFTGYASAYVRRLADQGRVEARKVGRDWPINRESLLAYKRELDAPGDQPHLVSSLERSLF